MYVTIAIIIILISLLWKLGGYNHGYFKKLRIPFAKPLPYLGNMLDITKKGFYGLDIEYKKQFGKIHGTFLGSVPILVIHDEELIKQICIKEAQYFTDRLDFDVNGYPLRKSITVLKGSEWKRVRNILTPTFTAGKIKKMTPLIHDCVQILQKRFITATENGEDVDIKAFFSGFTIDVIASTMFGVRSSAQENPDDQFYSMSKRLLEFSFFNPFLILLIFWPKSASIIKRIKPGGFFPADVKDYFLNSVKQSMEARKSTDHKYHDLLALMLQARASTENGDEQSMPEAIDDKDNSENQTKEKSKWGNIASPTQKSLSEEEILAQSLIMMIAGFETTSATLSLCAYYLAKNPQYQDKCIQEIKECLGDDLPDYDNVSKLHWLDLCIQETLRINPPAMRFDRVAARDITLTDSEGRSVFIPKGLDCSIPVHGIQCDPELWDNPMEYNPTRFENGELENRRHHLQFIPFGIGPRNCIGMRFALLELKVALAHVLRVVRFVPCDKTTNQLKYAMSGAVDPKEPIILKTEKL